MNDWRRRLTLRLGTRISTPFPRNFETKDVWRVDSNLQINLKIPYHALKEEEYSISRQSAKLKYLWIMGPDGWSRLRRFIARSWFPFSPFQTHFFILFFVSLTATNGERILLRDFRYKIHDLSASTRGPHFIIFTIPTRCTSGVSLVLESWNVNFFWNNFDLCKNVGGVLFLAISFLYMYK